MDIIECLMNIGLTRHESVLYMALCKEGELTGYEAAKVSGIPRSNAYLALAGLVEKGGAFKIDSDAVKYTAVPVNEFVTNIRAKHNKIFDFIEKNIPVRDNTKNSYITVSGKANIVNKAKNMITAASERIYISVSADVMAYVMNELKAVVAKGLKVVIITDSGFELERAVIYHDSKQPGQIRLIVDTEYVLTGELSGLDPTCLYSSNRNLIQLIKETLTAEIKLIQESKK